MQRFATVTLETYGMRKYNDIVAAVNAVEPLNAPIDYFDLDKVLGSTNTIAMVQQESFEATRANLHILKAYLTNYAGLKADRVIACRTDSAESQLARIQRRA